jgi:hypothetical protein
VTPTSTLAGVLTGLLDGTLIVLIVVIVLLGAYLVGRRQHGAPAVHPVAEDRPKRTSRIGELPSTD